MTSSSPAENLALNLPEIRPLKRGRLDLEFAADEQGRTYLGRQYASYPFHVCRVLFHEGDPFGFATLYLQSCSGGLYENDELDVVIVAREGAEIHLSSQSSTVVHGMPSGQASYSVQVEAQARSFVEYLPDPQILFRASRLHSQIRVRLFPGATAIVSDSVLVHDPRGEAGAFAAYTGEIAIEDAEGRILALDRLKLDGSLYRAEIPGITGAFAVLGTYIVASLMRLPPQLHSALEQVDAGNGEFVTGASFLPNSAGVIVRILAADGAALKRAMSACWCATRVALKGTTPKERRK